MSQDLKVLYIASEATPFIKVGGLGDVAGSLPIAIRKEYPPDTLQSIDVRLVIPYHKNLDTSSCTPEYIANIKVQYQHTSIPGQIFHCTLNKLPVYFVKGEPIESSENVYSPDTYQDGVKFTFFSMACLELVKILKWQPDIIHANDWHTSPAIYALSLKRKENPFFHRTKSLLTIHNLPYLGIGAERAVREFGLPPAASPPLPEWARRTPLALGLLSADKINTVSPGYAQEILTKPYGAGLDEFLRQRSQDICGILNGIDTQSWNPETDSALLKNYSLENLALRKANKKHLQKLLHLNPDSKTALLGMVTRMDVQKGMDLIPASLRQLTQRPWQAVILGSGDPKIEEAARMLEQDFPTRIKTVIRYDDKLARKIYAGADMLLIPSRYEPCGLTQMIAMRYGNVPVARATGGLCDTIYDYALGKKSTGFLFNESSAADLSDALHRALDVFADKRRWRGLQVRGMKTDFSWEHSASKYAQLYFELSKKRF